MYISFCLIAMAGLLTNNIPSWELDYRIAKQFGERQQKPLAIFLGRGSVNWQQLTREGKFDTEVQKALTQQFVRVYVDVDTDYGQKVAGLFGLGGNNGLFISDRSGGYQAFRHDGLLNASELLRHLNRYANPDHVVYTTETNQPAPVATVTTVNYQNLYAQPCLT